ncbi:MAG: hypothetical protein Q8R92_17125 [Deltaproteobacteria bacterium]|nr:hypothetical protein [Deltaproteobacteria bacterium]
MRRIILLLGMVVLFLAVDTVRNSGGALQELWLSHNIERYIASHPHTSESDKIDLRAGRVVKGWDREKCRLAWGEPKNVFTITQMGTEYWQYGGNTRPATLVFTEGVLTDFGP